MSRKPGVALMGGDIPGGSLSGKVMPTGHKVVRHHSSSRVIGLTSLGEGGRRGSAGGRGSRCWSPVHSTGDSQEKWKLGSCCGIVIVCLQLNCAQADAWFLLVELVAQSCGAVARWEPCNKHQCIAPDRGKGSVGLNVANGGRIGGTAVPRNAKSLGSLLC